MFTQEESYNLGENKRFDCFKWLKEDSLKYSFIMGLFDKNGSLSFTEINTIKVVISYHYSDMLVSSSEFADFLDFIKEPYEQIEGEIIFSGINGLDFLGKLYENVNIFDKENFKDYTEINLNIKTNFKMPLFKWCKVDKRAVPPFKARVSDSGYDLTIIDIHKQLSNITTVYTTGIKVQSVAYSWYFDLVPRSSVIKSGYILSNMVGVIDRGYTGIIYVALTKIDPSLPDLQLPNRIVQLIPRPIIHGKALEVPDFKFLEETNRKEKGFGSSSKG